MEELIESNIIDPISKKIFADPVLAKDGFIYERSEITTWFQFNKTSPMTQKSMCTELTPVLFVKNAVKKYLELHPEQKINQYQIDRKHLNNLTVVREIINKKSYNTLLEYTNFDPEELFKEKLSKLFKKASVNVIKHIIDYNLDLEYADPKGCCIIHYIVESGRFELIKYIIDQDVNLECETIHGIRPIHMIMTCKNLLAIKYLVEKGVDLECMDIKGWRPINYAKKYGTLEILKYLLAKVVNCVDSHDYYDIIEEHSNYGHSYCDAKYSSDSDTDSDY